MNKKKLILPIMMSALCVGAGVAGVSAYNNAHNAPGIVQTVNTETAEANNEDGTMRFAMHPMYAATTSADSTSNSTSESTSEKTETKDEIVAKAVDSMITAIGEVTEESRDAIKEAKTSYEDLTYEQQKLVKKTKDLENAIKEYNKLIRDDEDIRPIESLQHKNFLSGAMEEHKGLKTALIVVGTITGLGLFYLAYLGIKKLIKFFRR